MRHSYDWTYRGFVESEGWEDVPRSRPPVPAERVPGLIDALDCLLALWIAESVLGDGGGEVERPPHNPHEPPPEIPNPPGGVPPAPPEHPVPPGPPERPTPPAPAEVPGPRLARGLP